jgi:hypothetical protein
MANVVQIVISALNKTGQGLTAPIRSLDDLQKAASKLRPAMMAMAATAGAAAVYMANKFLDTADAANKSAQATGLTAEAFTSLSYAANLGGVSTEAFEKSLVKLAKGMNDTAAGTGSTADTFARLGVSVSNADGTLRATDQVMMDIAERFAGMQDGAAKTAAAVELFGKSGQQMIPVLNAGAAGLKEMQAEADALGVTISGDSAAASERFNDAMQKLQSSTQGVANVVMAQLVPSMASMAEQLVEVEKKSGFVRDAAGVLVGIIKALAGGVVVAWTSLKTLGEALAAIVDTIYSGVIYQVNVAVQLFQRWAQAIVEVGKLIRSTGGDLKTFASGIAALARGEYGAAIGLLGVAYDGVKDEAANSFFAIQQAASDSASIVSSNTAKTLDYLSERWKVFGSDAAGNAAAAMGMLDGLWNPSGGGGAPKPRSGGGEENMVVGGDDGYFKGLWEQIAKDEEKARGMLSTFRLDAMSGIGQLRAAEVQAYNDRLSEINGLMVAEETALELRTAAYEAYSRRTRDLERANQQHLLQGWSNSFGNMASMFAAFGKKAFAASKGFAIAQAIVNVAQGVTKTMAEYPYPVNLVFAATVAAAGAGQIATIASQQPPSYAVGSEYIQRSGPAIVHEGERIIQSNINADLSDFLDRQQSGPAQVTILLDGEVLARALGSMSRDGRLELSARAIA